MNLKLAFITKILGNNWRTQVSGEQVYIYTYLYLNVLVSLTHYCVECLVQIYYIVLLKVKSPNLITPV